MALSEISFQPTIVGLSGNPENPAAQTKKLFNKLLN